MTSLALKIKELREKAGLSQQELANKLGVSPSSVGMWESGRRGLSHEKLKAVANLFEVTLDYLSGTKTAGTDSFSNIHSSIIKSNNSTLTIRNGISRQLSEQEEEMLRIFESLSTKKKAQALLHLYELEEKQLV